jgi:hypothetical protein
LSDANCIPLAQTSLRWTRQVLEDDVRTLLGDLPTGATAQDVALHHGSVTDLEEDVLTQARPPSTLRKSSRGVARLRANSTALATQTKLNATWQRPTLSDARA